MSYEKINWKDNPETPINAENLNHMDEGIKNVHNGENTPLFTTFDDKGQETLMVADPIVQGDTMAVTISKITKYTNNIRYLIDLLNQQAMNEAGYYQVGTAIADLVKKLEPQFVYMWLSTMQVIQGTHVPYDQKVIVGDVFSYSDGIITYNGEEDIAVRCSATVGGCADNNRCWIRISRERDGSTTTIADAIAYGTFFSPSCTAMCQCQKGDKFSLYISEQTTVKGGGVGCYFSVEKVC